MASPTLKKEENEEQKTFDIECAEEYSASQDSSINGDVFDSLQRLEDEAARLVEQKINLAILLNQLENEAKAKVEKRKREVERLNSEILELKQRCEKMRLLVNSK